MPYFKPWKDHKMYDGVAYSVTAASGAKSCRGFHALRIESITSATFVDAGGIDCKMGVQGRCSELNTVNGGWNAAEGTVTHSAISETKISSVVDIRGYSEIRFVYTKEGATAGTITALAHLV